VPGDVFFVTGDEQVVLLQAILFNVIVQLTLYDIGGG
jgi:hypothetical protein